MNKKITIAEQDLVSKFEEECNEILEALEHPEALITDESIIADFLSFGYDKEHDQSIIKKLQKHFNDDNISSKTKIVELASSIREKNKKITLH